MPRLKTGARDPKQKMQYGVQEPAGVLRREIGRGFSGDDDQPQNGGDPGFESLMTFCAQAGWNSGNPTLQRST